MFKNQYPHAAFVLSAIKDTAGALRWLSGVEEDALAAGADPQEAGRLAFGEVAEAIGEYSADRAVFPHLEPIPGSVLSGWQALKAAASWRYDRDKPAGRQQPAIRPAWLRVLDKVGRR